MTTVHSSHGSIMKRARASGTFCFYQGEELGEKLRSFSRVSFYLFVIVIDIVQICPADFLALINYHGYS